MEIEENLMRECVTVIKNNTECFIAYWVMQNPDKILMTTL